MLRTIVRYATYLALFFVGLVAISVSAGTLIPEAYRDVGVLVVLGYIAAFVYWSRRRQARFADAQTQRRQNRVALLGLGVVGIVVGALIFIGTLPFLRSFWVHPLVAPVAILPLVGIFSIAMGVWALVYVLLARDRGGDKPGETGT